MEVKTIVCRECNEEHSYPLRQYNNRIKNGKKPKQFCTAECRRTYDRKNKLKLDERQCIICNVAFEAHRWTKTKCCSRKCADQIAKPKVARSECNRSGCTNEVSYRLNAVCDPCKSEGRAAYKAYAYRLPDELTLGEAMKRTGANRYDSIRGWSRKKIISSGKEMKCEECGYDKHVEIAHIKSISSFQEDAMVSEINSFDNLKILCPNCHWELDH